MSSNSYNFCITAGESFLVYLNAQNSNGTPINLSGFSARGIVLNNYSDTGYIYNLNPSPILPFESGIIEVQGTAQSTQSLIPNSYIYDIEIYNNSYALKILNGDFNVYPSTSFNYNGFTGSAPTPATNTPTLNIGTGSPEGIVYAIPGSVYTDSLNVKLYQKITGVGPYGWQ